MLSSRIYYVEDDDNIGTNVSIYLKEKGYDVEIIPTVSEAKAMISKQVPKLCLVDWNLPDGTGEELCRWIRSCWKELPVIFITVNDQVSDIVNGFNIGADDYITKPFELEILYSRICALLRRAKNINGTISCGSILVDTNTFRVWDDYQEIQMSSIEYQLLLLLIENKNKTVTRKFLLEKIWDVNGNYVNDNTLTVNMKRLREKLHNPQIIKTIRSFGYRMEEV